MGLVYNPIHNRKDNKMETVMRLMMVLVGFIIAMLGVITCNTFRTSHVRFNDKLCRCCVYVWGVTR